VKLFIVAIPWDSASVDSVVVFKSRTEAETYLKNRIEESVSYVYQEHVREIETKDIGKEGLYAN